MPPLRFDCLCCLRKLTFGFFQGFDDSSWTEITFPFGFDDGDASVQFGQAADAALYVVLLSFGSTFTLLPLGKWHKRYMYDARFQFRLSNLWAAARRLSFARRPTTFPTSG